MHSYSDNHWESDWKDRLSAKGCGGWKDCRESGSSAKDCGKSGRSWENYWESC